MDQALAKPRRVTDEGFLTFVRSRYCCVPGCVAPDTDPHHTKSRGSGGSDYTAIPLCRVHHNEIHVIGSWRFETLRGLGLATVSINLLEEYLIKIQDLRGRRQ